MLIVQFFCRFVSLQNLHMGGLYIFTSLFLPNNYGCKIKQCVTLYKHYYCVLGWHMQCWLKVNCIDGTLPIKKKTSHLRNVLEMRDFCQKASELAFSPLDCTAINLWCHLTDKINTGHTYSPFFKWVNNEMTNLFLRLVAVSSSKELLLWFSLIKIQCWNSSSPDFWLLNLVWTC